MNSSITTSAPARAERAVEHHGDRGLGLALGHRDHDALAGGKAVGLDHDRRALLADIGQGGAGFGEVAVGAGRNVNSRAQRLGEILRALEPRRRLVGPNALKPARVEIIDDAGRKRRFRADHDEIDRVALAELDHRGMVGDIERHAFGFPRDAGIARRAPEFRHQRRSRDLPRQRVFAAAGTEQKNVHEETDGR